METINPANDFRRLEIIYKTFFTICALSCFIAILPLPLFYYTFLRIIIFIGAGIVVYYFGKQKEFLWVIVFGAILVLFNPIIPIHFYLKIIWIPIDIVTGILFLLLVFIKKKIKELPEKTIAENLTQTKTFSRDRIIKTSSKIK
jgi:magnesium-transporting ATPase (P-type)